jgi:capsule polysaccharide modification protein KpsS
LNVIGVAILLQSTLILQPTHTPEQKRTGAITHSVLNGAAAAFLYAAFVVIVVNKLNHKGTHALPTALPTVG